MRLKTTICEGARWITPVLASFSIAIGCGDKSVESLRERDATTTTERDATTGTDAVSSDGRVEETRDAAGRSSDAGTTPPDAGAQCVNTVVFQDVDDDDFGVSSSTMQACLLPGERMPGYARVAGDCGPTDPWRNPAAEEICSDNVDDDCDGSDLPCPTTRTTQLDQPAWDCFHGPPPNNVYAWAAYSDGGTYFRPNGCFIFFEGLPNEFYAKRVNVAGLSTAPSCSTIDGCICPSLSGQPSYDRRLYAFTLRGTPESCPNLRIIDHGGETQKVSNDCRKYVVPLHYYDIPTSFFAFSLRGIERRISLYPTLEIACASEQYAFLPFRTLVTAPIQKNPGFVKK